MFLRGVGISEQTLSNIAMVMCSVSEIASRFHAFPCAAAPPVDTGPSHHRRPISRHKRVATPALGFMCGNRDNARRGIEGEASGLELYSCTTGNLVTRRNDANITRRITCDDGESVDIVGRLDGVCVEKGIVVEHKCRVHGLLGYVPMHENVQCHLYMFISGLHRAHLVETFGRRIQVHEISFCAATWARVREALSCGRAANQIGEVNNEASPHGGDAAEEVERRARRHIS